MARPACACTTATTLQLRCNCAATTLRPVTSAQARRRHSESQRAGGNPGEGSVHGGGSTGKRVGVGGDGWGPGTCYVTCHWLDAAVEEQPAQISTTLCTDSIQRPTPGCHPGPLLLLANPPAGPTAPPRPCAFISTPRQNEFHISPPPSHFKHRSHVPAKRRVCSGQQLGSYVGQRRLMHPARHQTQASTALIQPPPHQSCVSS